MLSTEDGRSLNAAGHSALLRGLISTLQSEPAYAHLLPTALPDRALEVVRWDEALAAADNGAADSGKRPVWGKAAEPSPGNGSAPAAGDWARERQALVSSAMDVMGCKHAAEQVIRAGSTDSTPLTLTQLTTLTQLVEQVLAAVADGAACAGQQQQHHPAKPGSGLGQPQPQHAAHSPGNTGGEGGEGHRGAQLGVACLVSLLLFTVVVGFLVESHGVHWLSEAGCGLLIGTGGGWVLRWIIAHGSSHEWHASAVRPPLTRSEAVPEIYLRFCSFHLRFFSPPPRMDALALDQYSPMKRLF
jgi:hypothetical protein